MHSPQLGSTGVVGTCFMFKFAMDGLSSAGLRVLLHVGRDEFSSTVTRANDSRPATVSCPRAFPPSGAAAQLQLEERVLWHAHYHNLGVWQQAQILYTFPELHTVSCSYAPSIRLCIAERDKITSIRMVTMLALCALFVAFDWRDELYICRFL